MRVVLAGIGFFIVVSMFAPSAGASGMHKLDWNAGTLINSTNFFNQTFSSKYTFSSNNEHENEYKQAEGGCYTSQCDQTSYGDSWSWWNDDDGRDGQWKEPGGPVPEPTAAVVFGLGVLVAQSAARRRNR